MFLRREAQIPTALIGTEIASAVPADQLEKVLRKGTSVTVDGGTELMGEDTFGREFLILLAGSAAVQRGGSDLATLAVGDIAGEMAILDYSLRTATVTSLEECTVMAFSRREMLAALAENEAFASFVRSTAAARQAA